MARSYNRSMAANGRLLVLACSLLVAACGGGGGSLAPGDPTNPPDPPLGPDEPALVQVAAGFVQPTAIVADAAGTLYVVERRGTVREFTGDAAPQDTFLDLRDRVGSAGSEQGLLGLAFAPDASGVFYVNYTDPAGDTVISRFTDAATEEVLLQVAQPFTNHNGGQLAFGPDGHLYIGLGDGGSAGDPQGNAQNHASLLGKILRLDVSDPAVPYAIPDDNPFGDEVWALGLRNPWRFSFDNAGNLYVADVGQTMREEINFQPTASAGGENYGWNVMEGSSCYDTASCDTTGFTLPVHEYDHADGCSVTGGYVTGGRYVYGDFCTGTIWALTRDGETWTNTVLLETPHMISTFGLGPDGMLYVADYATGTIYRLTE